MLELKRVSKIYRTGGFTQKALNSVSLKFREREFVSILGPSGSGKTTLLNLIGGLDQYSSGELVIDGISTKRYRDTDWDTYRNHRIGFVFQSYNLIPHQTVLNNVRLALTLSGISKSEAIRRSRTVLSSVGLHDHINKHPAELSGGQMQRVAIARALVNDPDILLADEPTGALDSETSVQIMELLKQIAADKLVIMVTHNPDLANQYSTRLIQLKDGKILADSNPPSRAEITALKKAQTSPTDNQPKTVRNSVRRFFSRTQKTKMSYWTALALSFNNLLTKKRRTILIALAGSIGIIGIALILSVSTGFQKYIDSIQEDALSSYPLTITEESFSLNSLFNFQEGIEMDQDEAERQALLEQYDLREYPVLAKTFSSVATNDLRSFKAYCQAHASELDQIVSNITYGYSVDPLVYTVDATGALAKLNPNNLFSAMIGNNSLMSSYSAYASIFTQISLSDTELADNTEILAGRLPEHYDEIMIVLPSKTVFPDLLAYELGLKDTSELNNLMQKLMTGERVAIPKASEWLHLDYGDLLNLDLRVIIPTDLYSYNLKYDVFEDMSSDTDFLRSVYDQKALPLKVVGVVTSKNSGLSVALNPGVAYSPELVRYIIGQSQNTEVVQRQLANQEIDVFSGNKFDERASFGYGFEDLVSVDSAALERAFGVKLDQSAVESEVTQQMTDILGSVSADITPVRTKLAELLNQYAEAIYASLETETDLAVPDQTELSQIAANFLSNLSSTQLQLPLVQPQNSAQSDSGASSESAPESTETPTPAGAGAEVSDPGASVPTTSDPGPNTLKVKILARDQIDELVDGYLATYEPSKDFLQLENDYVLPADLYRQAFSGILKSFFETYVTNYYAADASLTTDPENPVAAINDDSFALAKTAFFSSEAIVGVEEQLAAQMLELKIKAAVAAKVMNLTSSLANIFAQSFNLDPAALVSAFHLNFSEDELMRVMSAALNSSEKSAKSNLISLGYQDLDSPSYLSVYFSSFDHKQAFLDFLDHYNQSVAEDQQIKYTDVTGLLMDSVKIIVNAISYVLIAFVSISLVVSSIMIGIITYISVYERTKEIGILRAIGASKHNISTVFNAETFIIGLLSGLFGISFTYAVIPLINFLLYRATENADVAAVFPFASAMILVGLSVILTILGGLIPARSASKKDPVVALRTE